MSTEMTEMRFAHLPAKALVLYGKAVHVIAAADGRLTHEERELLFDDARSLGIDPEIIAVWGNYNWREATVSSILAELAPFLCAELSYRILYNAIRIALADEIYAIDERSAIDEAARILQVGPQEVEKLNALVQLEKGVSLLREGLFLNSKRHGTIL